MIGLKKFFKSKIIPYVIVLLIALILIVLWRTFSDTTKNEKYGKITVFDYHHRWYHTADRFSFDRIAVGETYNFKKSVPFYFAATGFQAQVHELDENGMNGILKNARLQTTHPELTIINYNLSIEKARVRTRSSSTFSAFLEFVEDLTELDRGTLGFLSKKVQGYKLVADYSIRLDTVSEEKPLMVFVELPGLWSYAQSIELQPVLMPAFRKYEMFDGEKLFLAHKNPYQSKAGLRFWAAFKYFIIVILVVLVILLKYWSDDANENDDDVSSKGLTWSDEEWKDYYENATHKALQDHDFEKALAKAEEAIQDGVKSEGIYINAISAAMNQADFEKAIRLCEEAEKLYPDDPLVYCLHGNIVLAITKDGEKAIKYFEKARELDMEGTGGDVIYCGLAGCNVLLGNIQKAVENISMISEAAYENHDISRTASLIYAKANMPEQLLEATTKWLKVAPYNKEAQSLQAQAKEALAKAQKESAPKFEFDQEEFERILNESLSEANLEKQVEKAMQLSNQGKRDEALNIIKTLPVGRFTNPNTLNNMARLYSGFGSKQQADELFTKAIELSNKEIAVLKDKVAKKPENTDDQIKLANMYGYAGFALYNTNQKSASLDLYINQNDTLAHVSNSDPDRKDILRALATSFGSIVTISKELGDTPKALTHAEEELQTLKKLLDLEPENIALQAEIALKVNGLGKLYEAENNNPDLSLLVR